MPHKNGIMNSIINWIKNSGLSNLGYVGGGIALWVFEHTNFAFALWGVAVYINFNVIRKLIADGINKVADIPGTGPKPKPKG